MAKRFEYTVRILEKHLDLFGHMNNASYLELYEDARWEMITGNGHGVKEITETQVGPVILSMGLKFKKEILNREMIKIHTEFKGMKNSKILILSQWMVKEDGKVASTVEMDVGLFDMKSRKLLVPEPHWLQAMGVI